MIKLCEGADYVTQDLAVRLLADEEEHLCLFEGIRQSIEAQPERWRRLE